MWMQHGQNVRLHRFQARVGLLLWDSGPPATRGLAAASSGGGGRELRLQVSAAGPAPHLNAIMLGQGLLAGEGRHFKWPFLSCTVEGALGPLGTCKRPEQAQAASSGNHRAHQQPGFFSAKLISCAPALDGAGCLLAVRAICCSAMEGLHLQSCIGPACMGRARRAAPRTHAWFAAQHL